MGEFGFKVIKKLGHWIFFLMVVHWIFGGFQICAHGWLGWIVEWSWRVGEGVVMERRCSKG